VGNGMIFAKILHNIIFLISVTHSISGISTKNFSNALHFNTLAVAAPEIDLRASLNAEKNTAHL